MARKPKKRVPEPEKSRVPKNDLNDALPVNKLDTHADVENTRSGPRINNMPTSCAQIPLTLNAG